MALWRREAGLQEEDTFSLNLEASSWEGGAPPPLTPQAHSSDAAAASSGLSGGSSPGLHTWKAAAARIQDRVTEAIPPSPHSPQNF